MLVKKDGTDGTIGSEFGEIEPDKDGVFDVPAELGDVLVRIHGFEEVIPEDKPAKAAKAAEPKQEAPAKPETAAAKKKREAAEAKAAKAAEDEKSEAESEDTGSAESGDDDEKSDDDEGDSQE